MDLWIIYGSMDNLWIWLVGWRWWSSACSAVFEKRLGFRCRDENKSCQQSFFIAERNLAWTGSAVNIKSFQNIMLIPCHPSTLALQRCISQDSVAKLFIPSILLCAIFEVVREEFVQHGPYSRLIYRLHIVTVKQLQTCGFRQSCISLHEFFGSIPFHHTFIT